MAWQEWIFSIGNVVFLVTLIPTMLNKKAYVPRLTSIPILAMLACYAGAFASMRMYIACAFCVFTVWAWTHIAVCRGTRPI